MLINIVFRMSLVGRGRGKVRCQTVERLAYKSLHTKRFESKNFLQIVFQKKNKTFSGASIVQLTHPFTLLFYPCL